MRRSATLRERSDFEVLASCILKKMAPDRDVALDEDVAAVFADYAWPGNLRQLANVLRTACALLDEGETSIGWQHLPDDVTEDLRQSAQRRIASAEASLTGENLQKLTEAAISRAIDASHGNMTEAARRLGISRNTLYRRMK
jgi:transcriptional regulator of acetoin/glycerol metabolism